MFSLSPPPFTLYLCLLYLTIHHLTASTFLKALCAAFSRLSKHVVLPPFSEHVCVLLPETFLAECKVLEVTDLSYIYHPKPQAYYFAQRTCSTNVYDLNSLALLGTNMGEFPLGKVQRAPLSGREDRQNGKLRLEVGVGREREGRGNRRRVPASTRG